MDTNKFLNYSTSLLYILLYIIVATISCICSIDFFDITHNSISSVILAISFEIGSMGCLLGALTTLKKNNTLIWVLFIFLTAMQMMNNTYYAYSNIEDYKNWVELFDLVDLETITQKRIISIISGCVLPLVSLSFIHLLIDLLKTNKTIKNDIKETEETTNQPIKTNRRVKPIKIERPVSRTFEAIPMNNDKTDFEMAKESMQTAIDKLEDYNERNNK